MLLVESIFHCTREGVCTHTVLGNADTPHRQLGGLLHFVGGNDHLLSSLAPKVGEISKSNLFSCLADP